MAPKAGQKTLFLALALSVLLAAIGTSMINLALPAIGLEFDILFADARLMILSYLLAATLFSLVIGRLADLNGRIFTLVLGTSLFAASALLAATVSSFWVLILARIVQGVGAAALVVLPIVVASEAAGPAGTGRSMGLLATMSAVGTASGPSLGGILLAAFGWRAIFVSMFLMGALNLILLCRFVDLSHRRSPGRARGLPAEFRAIVLDKGLARQLGYNLAVSSLMMTTLVVGPFYLSRGLGLSSVWIGLVMSAGPVTSAVSGMFSGAAVDRVGDRPVIDLGFSILLLGALFFVVLPARFDAAGFAMSAVVLSFGYQLFLSANSTRVMNQTPHSRRGLVSGALSLSRNLGLMFGTSVIGNIFDIFAKGPGGETHNLPAILHGLQAAFAAGLLLIGISFVSHLIHEHRRKNGAERA